MTNINLTNQTVNNNDILHITVTYGKGHKFITSHYVKGEALETFVKTWEKELADRGYKKEVNFIENSNRMVEWNGTNNYGTILCYTNRGYENGYKVAA